MKRKNLRGLYREDPFATKTGGPKRTIAQIETDLVFEAKHYLAGVTMQDITTMLNKERDGLYNLSYQQITKDIETIHARWIHSYLLDFDAAKAKELASINKLEQEYWLAWHKSQEKKEELETEKIEDKTANTQVAATSHTKMRVKKFEKERDGEVRFLQGIQWCIDQRCKILGLNQSIQNINVNWREEAVKHGIDPEGAVNDLCNQFLAAAQTPLARTGDTGSVGEGSEDTEG